MNSKFLGLMLGALGIIAQSANALVAQKSQEQQSEIDRIWARLAKSTRSHEVTFLYPRSSIMQQRFLFLAAHGSHVSHASHSSHVSHVSHTSGVAHKSGFSCQVFTPSPQPLSADEIIGFKDTKFTCNAGGTLVVYLPNSSLNHPTIKYEILHKPMYGVVTIVQDGRIIYAPDAAYTGLDSFSIYASDGVTQTEPVLFSVVVK